MAMISSVTEPLCGSRVGLGVLEAAWDVAVGVQDAQDVGAVRLLEVEDEVGEPLNRVYPQSRPVEFDGVARRPDPGLPGDEREGLFDRIDEPTCGSDVHLGGVVGRGVAQVLGGESARDDLVPLTHRTPRLPRRGDR